jgi:parallel beta-helix repeat protein
VTAEGNQGNGIIFSNHVTASVIENSVSRDNGENGIMMDATSTGNTIRRNSVSGNRADGIVLSNSASNHIDGNQVRGNRVGVHASGSGADSQLLTNNVITHNVLASQGLALPAGNQATNNGGQWLPGRVVSIWVLTAVGFIVLVLITWYLRRRTHSRETRGAVSMTRPVSVST